MLEQHVTVGTASDVRSLEVKCLFGGTATTHRHLKLNQETQLDTFLYEITSKNV